MNHTSGPWHFDINKGKIFNQRGNIIATVNAFQENGPVLAAAPELLRMLEDIVAEVEAQSLENSSCGFDLSEAYMVIKKARFEQNGL